LNEVIDIEFRILKNTGNYPASIEYQSDNKKWNGGHLCKLETESQEELEGVLIEEETTPPLSERDKAILQVFVVFTLSVSIAFTITYSDFFILYLGTISVILAYVILNAYSEELSTSMKQFVNPIEEAILAVLIYLIIAWLFLPLLSDFGILFAAGIIFVLGIVPILVILTRGCGYSFKSLGIKWREKKTSDERSFYFLLLFVFFTIFVIRVLPYLDKFVLILSPDIFVTTLSLIIYSGIVIGFSEELVFRGIVQPRLSQVFRSKAMGLLVTSAIFAGFHFLTMDQYVGALFDPVGSIISALLTRLGIGLVFGLVWIISEDITHPWGIHAMNNSLFIIFTVVGAT
jgi:membrane protease YdiL (CAAX protease family)